MKVQLRRLNDAFHMEASNDLGLNIQMDASPDAGGHDLAMRPMQVVLAALGGCSTIDVVSILQKQRADLHDIGVEIEARRAHDQVPAVFTHIHLHYTVTGNIEADKVRRAIELSIEKYCSVSAMLAKTAQITHSFQLVTPA